MTIITHPTTSTEVVTTETTSFSATSLELLQLADEARGYIGASKAPSTLRAYRSDWQAFTAWCAARSLPVLPAAPETVALYVADLAGVKAVATIQRRLTSISVAHQAAGHDSPTMTAVVRSTWRGVRRTFGTAQHGKAPARTADIRAMVATLDDRRLIGVRDRALLLVGFAGALRRSELVALDVADVVENGDGLVVTIRRSKTDQEGEGATLGLPFGSDPATCPVRALRAWLEAAGIADGAIFRPVDRHGQLADRRLSDRAVAEVVKRTAAASGLDPAAYAGHSLRAGLITSAAEAGAHERDIMRHSRHKSVPVMRRYIRDAGLFTDNAAATVGL
jgi:site-specific recombinase XerD